MTVAELVAELLLLPQDYTVVLGEFRSTTEEKVVVHSLGPEHREVWIHEPKAPFLP